MTKRRLELLAPAKNLECGMAAIEHGADAVYIGASRFGARAAAGNSVEDIDKLCEYAHKFGAKVYVTVNTIIYDDEIEATISLVKQLAEIGVDALLVQDMGLFAKISASDLVNRIALHASTQTDNRTAEKVAWLNSLGFERVVLARELSLDEIKAIHKANPQVELEVFVHGALCVSYSGACYASQYCFGRSANRGECAQFCRLKFDLKDDNGNVILDQRHALSLKDMCRIEHLEELADAGVCSFKIEGRLKDSDYVKNVVSAYSQKLDAIIRRRQNDYERASLGRVKYSFTPDLKKTFNRGFTTYFLHGRKPDIASFDTPKAMGEFVGKVKEIRGNSFNVAGVASFANGDGLCFINDKHELEGFRVNRAEGNRLYPLRMPENLKAGMGLYRNNDEAFSKIMSHQTAERKIPVYFEFYPTDDGFALKVSGEGLNKSVATVEFAHQMANKPQHDNIVCQLSKLGNTPYECVGLNIDKAAEGFFIPSSILTDLRRKAIDGLSVRKEEKNNLDGRKVNYDLAWQRAYSDYPYTYNIANNAARDFYTQQGLKNIVNAFEVKRPEGEPLLMQCRHCLRFTLGFCVKRGGKQPSWREPLHLELPDGKRFRLQFDCANCQMFVFAEQK
ncbi:MAG: U32 family peptidase [Prevotella sp.]|nr:U32 family peptidase [Prevotella sp.]